MQTIKFLSSISLVLITLFSSAQEYTLNDVGRYNVRNTGTIVKDNVIKGYFFFYESEKVDRKNRTFEIVVLDQDLSEVTSERITEEKHTYMMEATYNGSAVLFKFYNSKSKEIYYRTLSNEGTLSSKETREADKAEIAFYAQSIANDQKNVNLNNFGSEYFVDVTIYKGKKYTYKVNAIDKKGNIAWEYAPENDKGVLTGGFLASNEDYLIINEAQSKSVMSRDYTFSLTVLNKNGEKEFNLDLENNRYNLLPHNAYIDSESNTIIVVGEYFDADDKSMKSDSKGMFVKTISIDGEELTEEYNSWERDIYKGLSSTERKEASKYYNFFHNIVKTKDGKILAIGEQYRKQVSAMGVAFKGLAAATGGSTDASFMEIKIGGLLVVELGADYKFSQVKLYDKKVSRVNVGNGYGQVNQHILAKVIDAYGYFDYSFLQNNEDNSIVTIAFYDREKEEGKIARELKLNLVTYSAETGEYTQDKIDMETEFTDLWARAAKPGNILITEYDRKEGKIYLRLEPINF